MTRLISCGLLTMSPVATAPRALFPAVPSMSAAALRVRTADAPLPELPDPANTIDTSSPTSVHRVMSVCVCAHTHKLIVAWSARHGRDASLTW